MFLIDAHLDLAMNALEWNRDLRQPVDAIRLREAGLTDKPDREKGTVSFPVLRSGNIGFVVATQIARYVAPGNTLPGWNSPQQAWAQTQGQLAWYKEMEAIGEMRMITTSAQFKSHVDEWLGAENRANLPIGYMLSLEGADSLVTMDHLHQAYRQGLRAIGPAHYGPGRYANGTDATGRLNEMGKTLLNEMQQLNMILDATHLCDDAFWDAMDLYQGPVWASHNNCRSLVNHNRQFSDDQLKTLIERGAVIGAALDAWMMVPGWVRGQSTPQNMGCNLEKIIDHIDHICQLAGNCLHVGLGTDLDGAFGKEQSPADLENIADLQNLSGLLEKRGFSAEDIDQLFYKNWSQFLITHLPV